MRTTLGLFSKYEDAKRVVDRLMDKNIDKEKINILAQKSAVENAWDVNQRTVDTASTSAVGNKDVAGLDAILGRQRPVRTNTAGDLYAAGEIANIIAKTAAAPGETGSLKEALVDFGVEAQAAEAFSEGIGSGELLIFIRSDEDHSRAVKDIFDDSGDLSGRTYTV